MPSKTGLFRGSRADRQRLRGCGRGFFPHALSGVPGRSGGPSDVAGISLPERRRSAVFDVLDVRTSPALVGPCQNSSELFRGLREGMGEARQPALWGLRTPHPWFSSCERIRQVHPVSALVNFRHFFRFREPIRQVDGAFARVRKGVDFEALNRRPGACCSQTAPAFAPARKALGEEKAAQCSSERPAPPVCRYGGMP